MNGHAKLSRAFVFGLTLLTSATCSAWYAGHGGYYNGGTYYHGNSGYYHGGGYYGGGYYGGGAVVISAPIGGYYGTGYYAAPPCQTVRVCNPVGQCWMQRECP